MDKIYTLEEINNFFKSIGFRITSFEEIGIENILKEDISTLNLRIEVQFDPSFEKK